MAIYYNKLCLSLGIDSRRLTYLCRLAFGYMTAVIRLLVFLRRLRISALLLLLLLRRRVGRFVGIVHQGWLLAAREPVTFRLRRLCWPGVVQVGSARVEAARSVL